MPVNLPAPTNEPSPTWMNQFRNFLQRKFPVLFDIQPVPPATIGESSTFTSTMAVTVVYTSTMQ